MHTRDDEPISDVGDDRYHLTHGAYFLSKILNDFRSDPEKGANDPGLVLAVNGPWGSGKSSLIRILRLLFDGRPDPNAEDIETAEAHILDDAELGAYLPEALRDWERERVYLESLFSKDNPRFKFVEFNAWTEEASDGIALSLLDTINAEIEHESRWTKPSFKARRLAQVHGRALTNNLLAIGSLVSTATAIYTKDPGDSGTQPAAVSGVGGPDIEKLVKKIESYLKGQDRRLVLIIDDIDRMPPNRIQSLILALRWIRELPNVTILLLYDHDLVVDGLARTLFSGTDGIADRVTANRYLEKIVQFSFEVPQPSPFDLVDTLQEQLEKLTDEETTEGPLSLRYWLSKTDGSFEDEYATLWEAMKDEILAPLINTPRLVNRLATVMRFSWQMRRGLGLDGRDLIAVEAIKMTKPTLLGQIIMIADLADQPQRLLAVKDLPLDQQRMVRILLDPLLIEDDTPPPDEEGRRFYDSDHRQSFLYGTRTRTTTDFVLTTNFWRRDESSWQRDLKTALDAGQLLSLVHHVMKDIASETDPDTHYHKLLGTLDELIKSESGDLANAVKIKKMKRYVETKQT